MIVIKSINKIPKSCQECQLKILLNYSESSDYYKGCPFIITKTIEDLNGGYKEIDVNLNDEQRFESWKYMEAEYYRKKRHKLCPLEEI